MTTTGFSTVPEPATLPDHTQLPESDGTFVKNFQLSDDSSWNELKKALFSRDRDSLLG